MAALPAELLSVPAFHAFLGVGTAEASFLSRHAQYRYETVLIPKRRGGHRSLMVPDRRLKFLQRRLLEILQPLYRPKPAAHGFVKTRSPITNANAHQGRPYLLNLDLENYFGVITRNRVRGVLMAVGVPNDVASAICDLTVVSNQLPQGAPTSPLLANMVTFRLDKDLTAFARDNRLRYTRYADDITLSSYVKPNALFGADEPDPGRVDIVKISPRLSDIITSNNFNLQAEKVRYCGRKTRKEVTGLVVNEFTNVRRSFVRNVRSSIYRMEALGIVSAEAEYRARYDAGADIKSVVRGRLEWIAQVRGRSFAPYRSLALRYNALFPDDVLPVDPTNEENLSKAVFVVDYIETLDNLSQGTAFLLDGVGLVTAHHVLEKMTLPFADLYLATNPGRKFKAWFSGRVCAHRDLAILDHNLPADEQVFLKLSAGVDKIKSAVTAVGYPEFGHGDGLVQKEGRIVGRNTKSLVRYVEVDMQLGDGLSGGPIINERYEVVAVVHKGGPLESKQLGVDIGEVASL